MTEKLNLELTDALKESIAPQLRSLISGLGPDAASEADQLVEFFFMLLNVDSTLDDVGGQFREVIPFALTDDQLASFMQQSWQLIQTKATELAPPVTHVPTTPVPVAAAPSITNVKAANAAAASRKRLDRSAATNPEVATAAPPSKLIKLNTTKAAPTTTTTDIDAAGQPSSGQPTSSSTSFAGQPSNSSTTAATGQPKKIVKLTSGSAEARKAKFETPSTATAMEIDISQPTVPVRVASTAASSTTTAPASSINTIRKLRNPNEKKYTYEDEARERAEREEKEKKEREEAEKAAQAAAEAAALKKRTRCLHWPQCTKGDLCEYHHPTQMCTKFPNCTFGDSCLNIHPMVPCKFGVLCTNAACGFSHPQGRRLKHSAPTAAPPAPNSVATPCKFGVNCARPDCFFTHPPQRAQPLGGKTEKLPPTTVVCRFDPRCLNPKCPYQHPSKGQIPATTVATTTTNGTTTATTAATSEASATEVKV